MSQGYNNLGNGRVEALEQRVHRLEDAVAAFHDTRQLEDRVAARVTDRLSQNSPLPGDPTRALVLEARRPLLTTVASATRVSASPEGRQRWLLVEAYYDARAMFRMFVDPRYRVRRWFSLIALGLAVAISLTWLWSGFPIPVVGFAVSKIIELVLLFLLFKCLVREARRYRTMFPDSSLPPPV
jgi:hypothetical protein